MSLTVDRAPAPSILTAEITRSATIADIGPGEPPPWDASRLEAAWLEFYAQVRRLEQAKARLQATVEQAKGILMAQQRCGPDEAFDLLRRASQRANIKVSVLAAHIVEQVAAPGPGGAKHARPASKALNRRPLPGRQQATLAQVAD